MKNLEGMAPEDKRKKRRELRHLSTEDLAGGATGLEKEEEGNAAIAQAGGGKVASTVPKKLWNPESNEMPYFIPGGP